MTTPELLALAVFALIALVLLAFTVHSCRRLIADRAAERHAEAEAWRPQLPPCVACGATLTSAHARRRRTCNHCDQVMTGQLPPWA